MIPSLCPVLERFIHPVVLLHAQELAVERAWLIKLAEKRASPMSTRTRIAVTL
jgi:hypothetical protein